MSETLRAQTVTSPPSLFPSLGLSSAPDRFPRDPEYQLTPPVLFRLTQVVVGLASRPETRTA